MTNMINLFYPGTNLFVYTSSFGGRVLGLLAQKTPVFTSESGVFIFQVFAHADPAFDLCCVNT